MAKKKPHLLIREMYEKKQKELEKKGKTFTWEDFATAMGMENPSSTRSNVAKILGEDYNPTFKKLCNIAEALDVKVSALIKD
jgi:transcriptional regulator with XRE-family HTH domain